MFLVTRATFTGMKSEIKEKRVGRYRRVSDEVKAIKNEIIGIVFLACQFVWWILENGD
jgi:hypothetical protein